MPHQNGRRHVTIDLHPDEFEVTMLRVERRTEIAVRITRNAARILTIALGAVLTGLWSLHTRSSKSSGRSTNPPGTTDPATAR